MFSYLSAAMCAVHLQNEGQKLSPSGMPGTRTVAGTDNCSEGEILPSPR